MDPVLASAFVSLLLALALFFWTTTNAGAPHLHRTLVVCWLLFAMFASLVLFRFFPTSEATGTILGMSVGGAAAVFLAVWYFGPRLSIKGERLRELEQRIHGLEEANRVLQLSRGSREAVRLPPGTIHFTLTGNRKKIVGLKTGNLASVKGVDLWVNSENTYMQMARFFEKNVSGTIRYLGATKDKAEDVVDDVIGKALALEMGTKTMVQPGVVIETTSGELLASHGVKRLLHVAAVRGQAEAGFTPVDNIGTCVTKVLDRASRQPGCRSILFPLLGAGTGKGNLAETAHTLITTAISWLETSSEGGIDVIYFLTWTDVDRDACMHVLETSARVQAS